MLIDNFVGASTNRYATGCFSEVPVVCIEDGEIKVNSGVINLLDTEEAKERATSIVANMKRKNYGESLVLYRDARIKKANLMMKRIRQPDFNVIGNGSRKQISCSEEAPKLTPIRVPVGISANDNLRLFDTVNNVKTKDAIEIPGNAYDGKCIDMGVPSSKFKYLACDGSGYCVGGSYCNQHGVRLAVHKQYCRDVDCQFYGCSDAEAGAIFSNVDEKSVNSYKNSWNSIRLSNVRKHCCLLQSPLQNETNTSV
jgi:hypothetical protein